MQNTMVREAVAVFDDPRLLEAAVSDLQSRGFDRSDISFLAHEALVERPDGSAQMARAAATPRAPAVTDTDVRQERMLATSLAAVVAAFAAAGFTVATGGVGIGLVAFAAAAAGTGVGAVGAMVGRRIGQDEAAYLDEQLQRGGVLLWVRLRGADAEQRALEVLRRHSAQVQVHDLPAHPHAPLPSDR